MATIRDYGGTTDPLGSPPLGGPGGWCEAVADKFDEVGADGWVTAARLAADSVTAAKIAADAVGTAELVDGSVTAAKLEPSIQGRIGNLLTPNQARGGDALASTEGFWPWICTLSYDPADPAGAIVGTKTAATDGAIAISRRPITLPWIAHTFYIDGRKRTCTSVLPVVWFYDAGGSLIGSGYSLSSVVTSSEPFSAQMTMLPPAGAVEFSLELYGTGAVAAQWSLSSAGAWVGAGGRWAPPGEPIAHLGIRPDPSNAAQVQVWNDATSTWITV